MPDDKILKDKNRKKKPQVFVIAPGYPFSEDKLEISVRILESWGFDVEIPSNLLKPYLYHSQRDEVRIQHIEKALLKSKASYIWAVRGGYGSNRLIPGLYKIKKSLEKKQKKILIGLSDVTSLHLFFNNQLGWPTLHAPVLESLSVDNFSDEAKNQIKNLLLGNTQSVTYKLKPFNRMAINQKSLIQGKIIGGNLTVIQSHLGTLLQPIIKNKFLFIEDTGERGYRIDRMLYQLIESKVLRGAKGILFGEFTGGNEPDGSNLIDLAIDRFSKFIDIPVYGGVPCGHGAGYRCLPFYQKAQIQNNILSVDFKVGVV